MDHDWEELPLITSQLSEFDIKDSDIDYQFKIKLNFIYDNISSLKRCRNCGLEVINNTEPQISCDEQQIKTIMES